ncbi:hypothetical protein MNB_SM-3-192 [hydrothermal vent metagenome]|uniref:Uncharacterized protein n=1 Tax=hydrothermal vent metagenome TaxID=652676 RepID=A0A1W1D2S5_9ZZZZ
MYFSLQSSLVEKFVLPYIEPIIKEKSGYDVHIGHFSFDLLGHLHLQDITVKNPDTTLHMHSFDMVYDIWKLFDKNIVIRDIALKDISLFAHLHPLVGQTQPQTKQENNTTFSLQQILPLPFAFELEHFTIEPVHIDVDFSDATKQAHYKGDMYLKSAVLLENAKLSQRVVFDINNTSLSVIQHQKDQNVSLSLRDLALFFQVYGKSNLFEPLKSHLQWNFKQDMKNLSLALEQNQTNIKLTPLHLQLYLDGGFKESLVKNNLKLSLFPFRVQGRKDTLSFVATPSYFGDFNTTIGVEKQDKNFKFQPLQVAMQQDINAQNVTIKNNKQNLSFKKEQWKLTGEFIHHHINVRSKLSIYHLNTPLIQKQTTIHNKFAITTDTKLKKANITTALNVDSLSLIDFALVVKNQPKTLLLFPKIKLFVPQSLQQYKKEFKALQQVGDIDMDIQGDIQIHHNKNKLLDVNWSNQSTMPIQMDMTLTLHQQSKPKKGELKIQGPLVVRVVASRDKAYQTQLYLKSFDGVFYPPLQKPLPFDIWVQNSFDTTLRDIKSKGNIGINHQKFFAYDMAFLDKAYDFRLYLQSSLQTKTQWQAFLSQLQPLSKVGDINLESTLDVNLTHPLQTVQKLTKKDINTIGAKVQFDGVVQQKGTTQETLLFLQKPLAFSQNVQWHKGGMAFRGDYDIASLAIKKQLALQKVKLHMDIKADDGLHPHTVWAKIQGDGDGLKITQNKPLQLAPYIFPFGFDGKVHQNNNDIALQNVAFSFGDKLLEQTLHGMFSLDSKNLSMDGNTSIHLRKDLFGLGTFTNLWKV